MTIILFKAIGSTWIFIKIYYESLCKEIHFSRFFDHRSLLTSIKTYFYVKALIGNIYKNSTPGSRQNWPKSPISGWIFLLQQLQSIEAYQEFTLAVVAYANNTEKIFPCYITLFRYSAHDQTIWNLFWKTHSFI